MKILAIAIIAGILLLWMLFEFGAVSRAPEIQQDIQSRAGGVQVESTVSLAEAYITTFCKSEASITLSGEVPDHDARAAFPERARDMFRFFAVEESLEIRRHSLEGFRRFMDQALIELGQLDAGCITLTDRNLLVEGSIRSERALAGVKERMQALGDLGFETRYDLTLPVLSEQALACQNLANKRISRDDSILFSFDSDVIHEIGRQLLTEIAKIGKLCPNVDVLVVGHTDSVADEDYNIGLGKRRAEAVVKYLVLKGFDAERLSPTGLGFSQPIADNSSNEGRAANRRIEFRVRED